MGQGVNFYGSNKVFGPPPGASDVVPLHTFINGEHIVSCWRLSHGELAEVNESGCVYLSIKSATTLFPVFIGSETEVRRAIADDIVKGGVAWKRPPYAIPAPRLPVRFAIAAGAVELAKTVGGTIEVEVDGPSHVLCHVRTKREDAPELEATDLFAELEHSRHIIARLSSLVEGAALHLVDGKPLTAPELEGYVRDLAEATDRVPPAEKQYDFELVDAGDGMQKFVALPTYKRDNESIFLRLMLIGGHDVSEAEVAGWTDEQALEADIFAVSEHLNASDNDDIMRTPWPSFIAKVDRHAKRHMITGEAL